jgi:cytidylate kinase
MTQPRISIISGSPGTGKSTIAPILAMSSTYEKAASIELDHFWGYIRKGYILPWENGSGDQNDTVIEAVALSAEKYAQNGYDVYVAGVIGPWFIEPWQKIAKSGIDVRYIILRPCEETTVSRFAERRDKFSLNAEIVSDLWHNFANLSIYESNVIDTTGQTIEESVSLIKNMINEGCFRIK